MCRKRSILVEFAEEFGPRQAVFGAHRFYPFEVRSGQSISCVQPSFSAGVGTFRQYTVSLPLNNDSSEGIAVSKCVQDSAS